MAAGSSQWCWPRLSRPHATPCTRLISVMPSKPPRQASIAQGETKIAARDPSPNYEDPMIGDAETAFALAPHPRFLAPEAPQTSDEELHQRNVPTLPG